jgi:hypothetical protein
LSNKNWRNALDLMSEAQKSNRLALAQLESAEVAMAECLRRLDKALSDFGDFSDSFWEDIY